MLFETVNVGFRNETCVKILAECRDKLGLMINEDKNNTWRKVVASRDPVTILKRWTCVPVINRAFYKMLELAAHISKTPKNVLCMCEAPGGFLQASRLIWPDANCFATSLNTKMSIKFDDKISEKDIWHFSEDSNILKLKVCEEIVLFCEKKYFDLVTSDGGTDHENLQFAEQYGTHLFLAQVYLGIQCLNENGTLIIKVFEGSTLPTCQIYELAKPLFKSSIIVKPFTSKCANSERYIVFKELLAKTENFQTVLDIFRNAMEQYESNDSSLYLIDLGNDVKSADKEFDFHIQKQIENIKSMQSNFHDHHHTNHEEKKRLKQAIQIASRYPNIFPKSENSHNKKARNE